MSLCVSRLFLPRSKPVSSRISLATSLEMQGCSISDPYPLASYSLPSGSSRRSQGSVSAIAATFSSVPGNEVGWATITAQGDGIHIIDVGSI